MQLKKSITIGKIGELHAARHLQKKGFTIEARNKRFGRSEIDIIARKAALLVFVEVKIRKSSAFGYPETFLTPYQERRYHEAATMYMAEKDYTSDIRFDVIALHQRKSNITLTHFEDAF